MKYKEIGYRKNFVIAHSNDIGKTKDEINLSEYQFKYNKREHHAVIYKRKYRTWDYFIYYGCTPIDPDEEVIQID